MPRAACASAGNEAEEKIISLNRVLFQMYGDQGWWPVTEEKGKAPVYHPEAEDRQITDSEAFEIIAGSILTQNTAWRNAEKAVMNLNSQNLLNMEKIAQCDERLETAIRPAGYFNQKAARLREISRHIINCGGIAGLRILSTETLREMLLSWKGIGPETADSILCYAFGRPVFAVDRYTVRLFEKLELPRASYAEIQEAVHTALPVSAYEYGNLHACIVRLSVQKETERLARLVSTESVTGKKQICREFQVIPGVGKKTAEDFWDMGYRSVEEFRDRNPQEMYQHLNRIRGIQTDPCMLYVFRCAVYYASQKKHDPELLKWWNWKDRN
ncbi:MAG: helix-hairpin-helix domain-containing protein [Desulfobacterales bacterium]